VLVSSVVTRSAAGRIEPPSVQGERLAETVLVPVDVVDDPAVVRLAARLAMAQGGGVLVGAVAGASGEQLDSARRRAREAEELASATGAEAESTVRVDTSATAGLAAIVAERGVTLVVTGWHKAAVAADVLLGGENVDLVAIVDAPVLAVLRAHDGYDRVVLALDSTDLSERRAAERDLAVAVASIAASASRGRAVVVVPEDGGAAANVARLVGDDAELVVDPRSRRDAMAAIARADDLVLMPSRPGGSPLHRDAVFVAALPVGCSVGVPARPHATTGLVTGAPTLVGRRAA
jgi:hypothetical protein